MAVTPIQNTVPQWTMAEKLNARIATRSTWEADFNNNYKQVADRIATNITNDIFAKLAERLDDAYRPLPSSSNPLELTYSFDIGNSQKVDRLSVLADETAELAPFNAWFQAFGKETRRAWDNVSCMKASYPSDGIEHEYFQSKMSEVGKAVHQAVRQQLTSFSKQPQNAALKQKVEWHQNSSFLDKLSTNKDNYISATMWI